VLRYLVSLLRDRRKKKTEPRVKRVADQRRGERERGEREREREREGERTRDIGETSRSSRLWIWRI